MGLWFLDFWDGCSQCLARTQRSACFYFPQVLRSKVSYLALFSLKMMEYGCLDMCKNKCCVSNFKTSQVNWCMYIILAGRSPLWEDHRFKANSSSTGLHSTPVSRNQNSPDSFGVPSTWEAEPGGSRPAWSTEWVSGQPKKYEKERERSKTKRLSGI